VARDGPPDGARRTSEELTMADSSKPRILLVDDEPQLLSAVARNLRQEQYELHMANCGAEALETMRNRGPFAVIVSDLRMPGMDGVALLAAARRQYPDTVRVLFTGQPDMERAIGAVNEGAIFRFITKPCSRVMMAYTLKGAIEQYELLTSRRVLLEQTLHGSIKALTDVLGLANPLAFGRATRLRQAASELVAATGAADGWEVEVAAMMSQIGFVILPPAVLEKLQTGEELSDEETEMTRRMPQVVDQILANIPRLEGVREILRSMDRRFSNSAEAPGEQEGGQIPWGARALKLIVSMDQLESEGLPPSHAFDTLRGREGWYDPDLLEAMAKIRQVERRSEIRELPLASLRPGMVMEQNLFTKTGILFLARGQEVTPSLMEKFKNFAPSLNGIGSIRVNTGLRGDTARTA
jgi:response regulator RpfG family c-di-GMP phosphodiesterase